MGFSVEILDNMSYGSSAITWIPQELWLYIISRLPREDLLSLSITCKLFNKLANDALRNVPLPINRRKIYKLGLVSLVCQSRFSRIGLDLSEASGNYQRGPPGEFSRDCLR